jgi:site-specific DNA-methyltransferase (adenine-specific)/site-specific DNA-methyltransferase (cytosine-N4-specific)
MSYLLLEGDAARLPLADRSVDLVFGSPPYTDARTYGIDAQRDCGEWVRWMLAITTEALRVARNCVVWVAAGVTRDRTYQPACEGFIYEWWKQGGSLYRPCYWHRVGIPGSGGQDWFRSDIEYCILFKRAGRLPWSDNTAMGHPPKWAPGGAMSHRLSDGTRRNQRGAGEKSNRSRTADGRLTGRPLSSHRVGTRAEAEAADPQYCPPKLANPGNLISIPVGGGLLGHPLAHENEAPFPEALAEWFIRSLCPPGGIVLDPFSGSGTTVAVAERLGRHGIGLDLRRGQAEIARRRIEHPHAHVPRRRREKSLPLFNRPA